MSSIDALVGNVQQVAPQMAPQGAQLNYAGMAGTANQNVGWTTDQQQQFIKQLQAQATGQGGPSLANLQFQNALDRGTAATASNIASARGLSPAAQTRLATQAQEQGVLGASNASAQQRMQEQMNAQGMLGNQLGQSGNLALGTFGAAGNLNQGQNQVNQQNFYDAQKIAKQKEDAQQKADAGSLQAVGGIANAVGGAATLLAPLLAHGGEIQEDDPRRDTEVRALSTGETVLPRSVSEDETGESAKQFVKALKALKNGKAAGDQRGFIKAIAAKVSEFDQRLKQLETAFGTGG